MKKQRPMGGGTGGPGGDMGALAGSMSAPGINPGELLKNIDLTKLQKMSKGKGKGKKKGSSKRMMLFNRLNQAVAKKGMQKSGLQFRLMKWIAAEKQKQMRGKKVVVEKGPDPNTWAGKTAIAMQNVASNSKEAIGYITWEMLLELPKTVKALLIALFSVLVIGFFPARVERVSTALRDRPFRYSFSGVIATVIVSGLIGLLAFSIILLPIAGILAAWFLLVWLLGFVAMCYSIGMKMCESSVFQLPDAVLNLHTTWKFMCGVVFILIIFFAPMVGNILWILSISPCIGAAFGTRLGNDTMVN